jgi:pathogenicity locus Cdd1 protein
MQTVDKQHAIRELRTIPGVGPRIAEDLWGLGVRSVGDLRGQSPEALYDRLCQQAGQPIDRCMLYVFRCAVYYASNESHDAELLKWWNWKR